MLFRDILICMRLQIAIVIMIEWATNKGDEDCSTEKRKGMLKMLTPTKLFKKSLVEKSYIAKLNVHVPKTATTAHAML